MSNPPSYNNNQQHTYHHLTRFFLIVSLFVMAVSIMAVYSTISASEYGIKKDDMHTHAIVHLVKSNDWLNDYEEQKLGEIILQSQIDNVNIALQNNTTDIKPANNYLNKYKSYIDLKCYRVYKRNSTSIVLARPVEAN
jgi:hypothetical protein